MKKLINNSVYWLNNIYFYLFVKEFLACRLFFGGYRFPYVPYLVAYLGSGKS